MTDRTIIDHSGFINRERTIKDDGTIITKSTQKIDNILERNKIDQNDSDFKNGYTASGDMKHVARVPLAVWEHWWREENKRRSKPIPLYGREMNEIARKHLNDPDNKFFRTGLGEIGKN